MTEIGFYGELYRSAPLAEKYAWINGQPGLAAVDETGRLLGDTGNAFVESDDTLRRVLRDLGSDWSGTAAEAAGGSLRSAAQVGMRLATLDGEAGSAVSAYGNSFEDLRGRVHWEDPGVWDWWEVPIDAIGIGTKVITGNDVFAVQSDFFRTAEQNRTLDAQAASALQTHENVTREIVTAFPTIEPAAAPTAPAGEGTGGPGGANGYGGGGYGGGAGGSGYPGGPGSGSGPAGAGGGPVPVGGSAAASGAGSTGSDGRTGAPAAAGPAGTATPAGTGYGRAGAGAQEGSARSGSAPDARSGAVPTGTAAGTSAAPFGGNGRLAPSVGGGPGGRGGGVSTWDPDWGRYVTTAGRPAGGGAGGSPGPGSTGSGFGGRLAGPAGPPVTESAPRPGATATTAQQASGAPATRGGTTHTGYGAGPMAGAAGGGQSGETRARKYWIPTDELFDVEKDLPWHVDPIIKGNR